MRPSNRSLNNNSQEKQKCVLNGKRLWSRKYKKWARWHWQRNERGWRPHAKKWWGRIRWINLRAYSSQFYSQNKSPWNLKLRCISNSQGKANPETKPWRKTKRRRGSQRKERSAHNVPKRNQQMQKGNSPAKSKNEHGHKYGKVLWFRKLNHSSGTRKRKIRRRDQNHEAVELASKTANWENERRLRCDQLCRSINKYSLRAEISD